MMPKKANNRWHLTQGKTDYTIWQPSTPQPSKRGFWLAAWEYGDLTDSHRGETLEAVLHIFPTKVADKFRTVIGREPE